MNGAIVNGAIVNGAIVNVRFTRANQWAFYVNGKVVPAKTIKVSWPR